MSALLVTAVGAEGGTAIGRCSNKARALASAATAQEPAAHLSRPLDPEVVRRHRHDCVFAQNTAPSGGAIYNLGSLLAGGSVFIDNGSFARSQDYASGGGAFYNATGKRIRTLPMTPANVLAALGE